ncbi:5-carboxymethyl-2-hydroxymuconate isomerase [Haematobacter massiliensis]|uniref:5-carboxymethyl-2-hydroxymuconate isomerase n=1 Tax=Haematobacter massiliensis TaxID=195105 RepID=A0A086XZF5_9RHOB|nr:fumarylacetoacetate hydrolase family protein [Haematobacter massiliensis]KFI27405.1 5-carboxymethyl-2-hydroxymuconate isomerase [Haematobacter massiliensis]OWJ70826.1 5-carboxymethyl-2-hydroxymuconate isomerase [Haematobacter massiliensis]OWJ84851.1 5-carboxymethyl-2-hydroxymuconate isomerase [Haematobacter massiliensis]QBJ23856.1 FAA hydrolase family protein [Haematobacter massiliensis]
MSDTYVIPAPPLVTLPISGETAVFPVRRVYCVGRNYAEHAREMGHSGKEPPFFFQKNPDNLVTDGVFPYPSRTADLHHEVELVVALAKGGRDIPVAEALDHVYGYAVGLDMTRRDLQAEAKKAGRPWEAAKAAEHSAPVSSLHPVAEVGHPDNGTITLKVDGELRQSGDLADQIWSVADVIAHLSGLFELAPGDLIMTGTPAGVGAVQRGQVMTAAIEGLGVLEVRVV